MRAIRSKTAKNSALNLRDVASDWIRNARPTMTRDVPVMRTNLVIGERFPSLRATITGSRTPTIAPKPNTTARRPCTVSMNPTMSSDEESRVMATKLANRSTPRAMAMLRSDVPDSEKDPRSETLSKRHTPIPTAATITPSARTAAKSKLLSTVSVEMRPHRPPSAPAIPAPATINPAALNRSRRLWESSSMPKKTAAKPMTMRMPKSVSRPSKMWSLRVHLEPKIFTQKS